MTNPSATAPGVFLLGVGAQKAGTSWLHKQLHSRPDADFGCLKEYHVHDARTIPALARFRRVDIRAKEPRTWIQPRTLMRQWFINNPKRYTDYFTWLLRRPRFRSGPIRLTGDITPSYALLSAETLGEIKTNFEQRGIPVKPVFLMRDPLERLISSQRMKLRKQGLRDPAAEIESLRQRVSKDRGLRGITAKPWTPSIKPLDWSTVSSACSKPCSHQARTQSFAPFWTSLMRSQVGAKKSTSAPPQP